MPMNSTFRLWLSRCEQKIRAVPTGANEVKKTTRGVDSFFDLLGSSELVIMRGLAFAIFLYGAYQIVEKLLR
jgi:hypothetical protein